MHATTFGVSKFYLNNINLIFKIFKSLMYFYHNIYCIFDKPKLGEHKSWLSKTLKKLIDPKCLIGSVYSYSTVQEIFVLLKKN